MSTSTLLSAVDITYLRRNVAQYSSQAMLWVNSNPTERDPAALPRHIASITQLIIDLRAIEMALPAQTFAPLHIHLTLVQDMLQHAQRSTDTLLGPVTRPNARPDTWEPGVIGRPRLACPEEMIIDLHKLGMTEGQLARRLHVSVRTIQRWKKALGLRNAESEPLTALQVQAEVDRCWKEGGGMEGYRLLQAAFKRKEIPASRDQVRAAVRALDSDEARRRFAQTTTRRVYQVPFANSLWHIDGHHKLIDVKIVIHGGIDGKSRKVVFLKASTNNRAGTVFESFQEAVGRYGVPSRVRGDYGKENLDVKRFMDNCRGQFISSRIHPRPINS